jgi:hypothetical protein
MEPISPRTWQVYLIYFLCLRYWHTQFQNWMIKLLNKSRLKILSKSQKKVFFLKNVRKPNQKCQLDRKKTTSFWIYFKILQVASSSKSFLEQFLSVGQQRSRFNWSKTIIRNKPFRRQVNCCWVLKKKPSSRLFFRASNRRLLRNFYWVF